MLRLNIEGVTAQEATQFIVAGLERQRESVGAKIAAVLNSSGAAGKTSPAKTPKTTAKSGKGSMSAEGKAKIAAAQKKRWAKVRKEAKAAAAGATATYDATETNE